MAYSIIQTMEEGRVVAYYPEMKLFTKSTVATIFLCQLYYWKRMNTDEYKKRDGWIWKTAEFWQIETGLTEQEQKTAKKILVNLGILQIRSDRLNHRTWYKVDWERVEELYDFAKGKPKEVVTEPEDDEDTPAPSHERDMPYGYDDTFDDSITVNDINKDEVHNPKKKGDLVDAHLDMMASLKKEEKVKMVKAYFERRWNIKMPMKMWGGFIKFALRQEEQNGEKIEKYVDWSIENGFDPIYWSPLKCETLWAKAFAKDTKPFVNYEVSPKPKQEDVLEQLPDSFFNR